jgi:S1-C subfamily serine protease
VVDGDTVTSVDVGDLRVDADRDLAFVPIAGLSALAWHTADPKVGASAWAVGYPDDGPRTVLPTTVHGTTEWIFDGRAAQTLLTIAGPVHPGDSGGPLLTADGAVAGVVVAGSTDDSALHGDGLVIRAATAQAAASALAGTWDPRRRLGLVVAPATGPAAGVTVVAVTPGSPAEAAGLKVGDQIEQVDGNTASPALLGRRTVQGAPQHWMVRRGRALREVHVTGAAQEASAALRTAAPLTLGPDGVYSLSLP